jgi:hypothetical protein
MALLVRMERFPHVPFLSHYAICCKAQNVQSAVSNKPEVGRGCDGYARIEEWAVFDRVAVEALRSELEHDD